MSVILSIYKYIYYIHLHYILSSFSYCSPKVNTDVSQPINQPAIIIGTPFQDSKSKIWDISIHISKWSPV